MQVRKVFQHFILTYKIGTQHPRLLFPIHGIAQTETHTMEFSFFFRFKLGMSELEKTIDLSLLG